MVGLALISAAACFQSHKTPVTFQRGVKSWVSRKLTDRGCNAVALHITFSQKPRFFIFVLSLVGCVEFYDVTILPRSDLNDLNPTGRLFKLLKSFKDVARAAQVSRQMRSSFIRVDEADCAAAIAGHVLNLGK